MDSEFEHRKKRMKELMETMIANLEKGNMFVFHVKELEGHCEYFSSPFRSKTVDGNIRC